jgi:hypothetical protein
MQNLLDGGLDRGGTAVRPARGVPPGVGRPAASLTQQVRNESTASPKREATFSPLGARTVSQFRFVRRNMPPRTRIPDCSECW